MSVREAFGSFTKDVGTASYVAPEVRSAGNGKYNEKADMYSLGVIFLEMSVPFSTGMERSGVLENLHKGDHTMASALLNSRNPALLNSENSAQTKLFESLIQIKPSQRPSSSELLDSGDIPDQAEDESLRMARRLLKDRTSHYRPQLISSLFATEELNGGLNPISSLRDPMQTMALLDDVGAMSASSPNNLEVQAMVEAKLSAIFQRHGAVKRTDSPALLPYSLYYPAEDVCRFVDATGKVMQLPYDLILPNAMLLARQMRPERKTFIFDNVYRVNHSSNRPHILDEADFDIVSGESDDLALREAEVLKVIDEILDTFPHLSSTQMCYHINSSQLLDAVLRFCNIDESKWPLVKEAISKLHIEGNSKFYQLQWFLFLFWTLIRR